MIYQTLFAFSSSLSAQLSRAFGLRDDIVMLAPVENRTGSTLPNKLLVSLVNIERETSAGISFNRPVSGNLYGKGHPGWQINLYVLIASLFSEKQYVEGLQFISEALRFIRNNKTLEIPSLNEKLAVEPVNLSVAELSNLWSICGGTYSPSVLCKIRVIDIGGDEIRGTGTVITRKETGL